jgi:poly(A) polymerase
MPASQTASLISALGKLDEFLAQQNCRAYIIGGFIRDWLLGKQSNDVDIAVEGNALSIADEVAKNLGGKFVLLDEVDGIARVIINKKHEWHFDFSSFSGSIESDLARRDFTIDAMAVELSQLKETSQLKPNDPFQGRKDLENRVIRAVSEQVFANDAIRLLRAIRLAAELDFTIEPTTETSIRLHSQSIIKVAGERVREELLRLFNLPRTAYYLHYLDKLGLLTALVPELAQGKGVEQPTVHFWDVFEHSLQTVASVEFLTRENTWDYGNEEMLAITPWSDVIEAHLSQEVSSGSNHKSLLKLGALFHDIAKPKTKSIDDTGRARFLGHAKEGAMMTASILERLRFSRREIDLVEKLVYHHLRPAQMSNEGLPTQRAIYRYFRDTGDAGIDILFLALADYLASRGPLINMEAWRKNCQLINHVLTEHEGQKMRVTPLKLIDGNDIMDIFYLTSGPLIGELLATVREAQASGEINTKEEALALVKNVLNKEAVN